MNELIMQYVREYGFKAATSLLATFGGCLGGCTMTLADKGEIGFKQSTEWGFYHTASKTDATAVSNVEAPTVVEWVTGKNEPAETEAVD